MSLEENKAIIRKMFEAINKKDLAVFNEFIDEYMAVDFVDRSSQGEVQGREHVKQADAMVLKEYPDLRETIEDIIAEGDRVWVHAKITGTDSSGKKMDATALYILRIVNGKFVEGWGPLLLQKTP
jgi:ketosteroid isomerase-like protein